MQDLDNALQSALHPPPPPTNTTAFQNPANAHAFNRRALKPFHSKPAASRAVYYKKAPAELPPWRGVHVDCLSYLHQQGAPPLRLHRRFTSSAKNVKKKKNKHQFHNGLTSNTAIKTISKSKNSAHWSLLTNPQPRFSPVTIPDCLHPIKAAAEHPPSAAGGRRRWSKRLHPGAYVSHEPKNATKFRHPNAPKPFALQPTTIPEVKLENIKVAPLPTVKFHHNSNNIDNNKQQQHWSTTNLNDSF